MEPAIIVSIVLAVIAVFSLLIAWRQYYLSRSQHTSTELRETIKQLAHEANEPLKEAIAANTAQLRQQGERTDRLENALKDNSSDLRSISDKLSQMGVKVDMYWGSLEQLAMNAAKGLHQPDPAREHVDHLLEAFMEGTLTADERIELKKVLVKIRNHEPNGPDIGFPVQQGEQTFAAILLSTMDIVDPRRMAAMGHNAHRSVNEKDSK